MTCDPLELTRYHDGELTGMELARMRGHVAGCEVCRRMLSEWAQIDELARRAFKIRASKRSALAWDAIELATIIGLLAFALGMWLWVVR